MVKLKGVQVQIMRKLKNIEQNMVNDNANMLIGMELYGSMWLGKCVSKISFCRQWYVINRKRSVACNVGCVGQNPH